MTDTKNSASDKTVLVTVSELKSKLDSNEQVTFVDVRNPKPWGRSEIKIEGAIRIDPNELPINSNWPKDRLLAFY